MVEVLVVVAIIAVLAAILLAVTAKLRQAARSAQATSNIRQIGVLMGSYTQDNNNCLPLLIDWTDFSLGFWQGSLAQHSGLPTKAQREFALWLPDLFYDPMVKDAEQHPWGGFGGNSSMILSKYDSRQYFGHDRGAPLTWIGLPERKVIVASAMDSEGGRFKSSWFFMANEWASQGGGSRLPKPDPRHSGKTLSLFADGHVESLETARMDAATRKRYFLPDGNGSN
jgi:prepilin-type processing-associated H-X9-DG protein